MRRVVISTVGTSLLTNQINRENIDEKDWYNRLRDTANLSKKDIEEKHSDVAKIMQALRDRAGEKLKIGNVAAVRRASAELNGIYGLYNNQLTEGKQDIHWLIPTDTAQGKTTAEIVQTFLRDTQGLNMSIYEDSPGISTANTGIFSDGMDKLIAWMRETIPSYKQTGYKICFNLVGSFKSLQGYLNTIGMFYADEIIYIFEGENSELITIPRLPITVDSTQIKPFKIPLALMNAGAEISVSESVGIPEGLVYVVDDEMTLSNWGKLVWNECKDEMLSQDLLAFPKLQYQPSFFNDYENIKNNQKARVKLQETLAKVSYLLSKSNGNTVLLKQDGGLQYDQYTNKGNIDHFRVTQGLRVSCISTGGNLQLRRYGSEPVVNNNP